MMQFLPQNDSLARLINQQASLLFQRMEALDASKLGMPEYCLAYFEGRHMKRLFFSIEGSAHLLYRALTLVGKDPSEAVLMDYGAGVGSLYMLAKMIGCRQVIYNDHLEDWRRSAELIANALDVRIDEYIVGDISDSLQQLRDVRLDAITSRNVIEHIYHLDQFFSAVYTMQPDAVIISSTSANKQNPATVFRHVRWHKKWERVYEGKRKSLIERQSPGLTATKLSALARATRGLAGQDLSDAVEAYRRSGHLPDPSRFGTNTCDPANGVWAENLMSAAQYRQLINEAQYAVSLEPGFWDTHYPSGAMNLLAQLLNRLMRVGGRLAMTLAPFIYVIAIPRKSHHV